MQTQTRDSSSASGLCVSAATALPCSGRARGSYLPAPAPDCQQALLKEPRERAEGAEQKGLGGVTEVLCGGGRGQAALPPSEAVTCGDTAYN